LLIGGVATHLPSSKGYGQIFGTRKPLRIGSGMP
jgi:hypothetical protein